MGRVPKAQAANVGELAWWFGAVGSSIISETRFELRWYGSVLLEVGLCALVLLLGLLLIVERHERLGLLGSVVTSKRCRRTATSPC